MTFIICGNDTNLVIFLQIKNGVEGRLAGPVGRACDSSSLDCEFKPRLGCRAHLKKKKLKKKYGVELRRHPTVTPSNSW